VLQAYSWTPSIFRADRELSAVGRAEGQRVALPIHSHDREIAVFINALLFTGAVEMDDVVFLILLCTAKLRRRQIGLRPGPLLILV
jgi:hypothetical protein